MKTNKLIVKDLTNNTLSNTDGVLLQIAIDGALADSDTIILSFHDIHVISSSFLNSSLGDIVDKHGFAVLDKIRIVDYTASISSFLRNYISDLRLLSAK
jgi:hypothetical protein